MHMISAYSLGLRPGDLKAPHRGLFKITAYIHTGYNECATGCLLYTLQKSNHHPKVHIDLDSLSIFSDTMDFPAEILI